MCIRDSTSLDLNPAVAFCKDRNMSFVHYLSDYLGAAVRLRMDVQQVCCINHSDTTRHNGCRVCHAHQHDGCQRTQHSTEQDVYKRQSSC